MKIRVVKLFGHEVLRIESHYEATVSDVVRAMIESRHAAQEEEEEEYICEFCGETIDDVEDDDGINGRFADMTERIVWDARTHEHPFPHSLFDKPKDEDED